MQRGLKVVIFISSGLGNAIMLVPAINALKASGHSVHGVFTSPFNCEALFTKTNCFDSIVSLKSKRAYVKYALTHLKQFDLAILDEFACTKSIFWVAKRIASSSLAQTDKVRVISKRFQYVPLLPNTHVIRNNLLLVSKYTHSNQINYHFLPEVNPKGYLVFQPGSGNNNTPWKNWPIDHWIQVLESIDLPIKVIGDKNEMDYIKVLEQSNIKDLEILIGKQRIEEMVDLVHHARAYVGHDSGPMHISVACGVPTFTIWGASPKKTYAYAQIFPKNNIVLDGQAEQFKNNNITGLDVDMVSTQLQQFLNEH